MNRVCQVFVCLLLCSGNAIAQSDRVTFTTDDDVAIAADFYAVSKDAPTVVCLHMFRSNRSAWKPLAKKLVAEGINVLAIDMRGHGESAGNMAKRVVERDSTLFQAMWQDAAAAIDFLGANGYDTSRIGLCGASVGCSVALETAVKKQCSVRSVCLMTPGKNYLGVDSIETINKWNGVDVQIWCSEEEKKTSAPVAEALKEVGSLESFQITEKSGVHGTRMFGKVEDVEDRITSLFANLKSAPIAIPAFAKDDPRTETGGFFFDTLRIDRSVNDKKYVLMSFAVGDTVTLGAVVYQPFSGKTQFQVGERTIDVEFDTTKKMAQLPVMIDGAESELKGDVGRAGNIVWYTLELEKEKWFPDSDVSVSLRFDFEDQSISIPSRGSFTTRFFDKPKP